MTTKHAITTELAKESDLTEEAIGHLANLINVCYDEAEAGMWKRPGTRTNPAEIRCLLRIQRLILAKLDGAVVGSVSVNLMAGNIGEFGMLVSSPAHRGKGIGRSLIDAAENWARQKGCHTMQLELLTPRKWELAHKEFMKKWYSRIGYVPQSIEPFENLYPSKVEQLATECDFTVWLKKL